MSEQLAEMAQAVETQAEAEVEQGTEVTTTQEVGEPEQQPGESNADFEQRLKTADNLIRKQKFQLKEFKRQMQQEREEREAIKKELDQLKAPKEPKEDDFNNYSDYLEAKILHKAHQQQPQRSEQPFTQEQALQLARQQLHQEQRVASVDQRSLELGSKIPDFVQISVANTDILQELPPYVSQAILNAEDGALAFYTLAKTGQLEHLASMTPVQAAYAVARAEMDGQKYLTKPTTQAPPPLKGARGASSVASDEDLSGKELLKKYGVS